MDHHTQYGKYCSLQLVARVVGIQVREEKYRGEMACDKKQRNNNNNNNNNDNNKLS